MQLLFASPAALWALLGLPLLVLANWLSGRYREQLVPNLMLWRSLTQEVASSQQRSRRLQRLKLLLELMLLTLLVIGAGQPQLRQPAPAPRRIAIVIDNSLRMQTRLPNGKTAWHAARTAAAKLIDQLNRTDQVSLLLTVTPDAAQSGWRKPTEARDALARAEVAAVAGSATPLVRAALALGPKVQVYQIGLGPRGPKQDRVVRIGVGHERSDNLGWIGFHAATSVGRAGGTVLGVLASAADYKRQVWVRLESDGTIDRKLLTLEPGGQAEVRFKKPALGRSLRLTIEGGDNLAADDTLTAGRGAAVRLDIRPSGKLPKLDIVARLLPEVRADAPEERTIHVRLGIAPEHPLPLPLVLAKPAASEGWQISPAKPARGFGRLARDPLFEGLNLSNVVIRETDRLTRAPIELRPIAWSIDGNTPLIARGNRLLWLAFALDDWSEDPSFPIFWRRLIQQFFPGAGAYRATPHGLPVTDNRGWRTTEATRLPAAVDRQLAIRDLRLPTALLAAFLLLAYASLRGKTRRPR